MDKILIPLHWYIVKSRFFNYLLKTVSATSWWEKTGMNISDFECYFVFFLLVLLTILANRIKRLLSIIYHFL